jgi:hypothetical protein
MDEDSYLESVPAGRVALEQWLSVLERRKMRVSRVVVANRLVAWALFSCPTPRFWQASVRIVRQEDSREFVSSEVSSGASSGW